MSVYVSCEEQVVESEQPSNPEHRVKWSDRMFNIAIVAVPTLVALPLAIWALNALGIQVLPDYSSTIISFYVLIIVSTIGIIYFLVSALTIPKTNLITENFLELTTAADAILPNGRQSTNVEHRLSQPLVDT